MEIKEEKEKRLAPVISAKGVCFDLERTPYTLELKDFGMILHFSSKVFREKFKRTFTEEYIIARNIELNIKNRTRNVLYDNIIPIILYEKLETRGVYIEYQDKVIRAGTNIKINIEV